MTPVTELSPADHWRARLREALTVAMKSRDRVAVSAYRSALGAIDNAEAADESQAPREQHGVIAGGVEGLGAGEVRRRALTGAEAARVLRREIEDREANARAFEHLGHDDRAGVLRAEAASIAAVLGPDDQVETEAVDPAHRDAQYCLHEYYAELDSRFDVGFDPAQSLPAELEAMRPPCGLFLLARLGSEPVGCGALKFHGDEPTELKRMWVSPSARGLGVGRRLLAALEARTVATGSNVLRLETNGALTEAIGLYRSAGYVEVDAFNDELYADHWFEKHLPGHRPDAERH